MGDTDDKKRPLHPIEGSKSGPRLLLHCADGCVPYLNPNQLEEHFPPSDNTDLWLGLAVRDACVAPIFNSPSQSDKGERRKKRKSKPNGSNETANAAAKINKVRGYTFAATSPDPWLLPYTRLTVPSFGTEQRDSISNFSGSKCTNNSVHVWTPHGRQKLTADLYATASLEGLQSQHTLSLFDDFDEEEFSRRRKQKALSRNDQWFQHLLSKDDALLANEGACKKGKSLLWKPILLPHNVETSDSEDKTTTSFAPLPQPDISKPFPSGLAFVGRWRPDIQLNTIMDTAHLDRVRWKAILTTRSLSEILEFATAGVANVIGTNLPQKWAKEKLGFGLDLSSIKLGIEERDPKRQKIESVETKPGSQAYNATVTDALLLNKDGCMDLSDKKYARDTRPLVPGCDSFVCKDNRFSRAYIHHLVVAKEMLAEILLFGHNLHCLLKLLRCFDCDESKRKEAMDFILRQLPSCQN